MYEKQGVIDVFRYDRGFGFVTCGQNAERERFFFHFSDVSSGRNSIVVGATVEFNILPLRQGRLRTAIQIRVLNPEEVLAQPIAGEEASDGK